MATTYLDAILAAHRRRAAHDKRDLSPLARQAAGAVTARPGGGFAASLRQGAQAGVVAVIAEVKRRSPSKGALATRLDPASLAAAYVAGGASCLSVLTDEEFFGGSAADLRSAREASCLAVLRKDFTVSIHDVYDTKIMGADCVLLIAAALDDGELGSFHAAALDVGLDVLVEVHDEVELDRAMSIDATLIGVNQRDLVTFDVDTERAERMASVIPDDVVKVAESGITGAADAQRLAAAGYHALLVGEMLVRSEDPARAVRMLRAGTESESESESES